MDVIFSRLHSFVQFCIDIFNIYEGVNIMAYSYYIINKSPDEHGYNEVHTTTCVRRPNYYNQEDLGLHANAIAAVNYAKTHGWPRADGCYYCCREAHHG